LLSVLLGAIFSHGFFEDWGWFAGPLTWLGCAWLTARVVGLAPAPTLVRAALAGMLSLLAVLVGQHWLGALIAIGLFAYLCAIDLRMGSLRADER
jgi:hypothetical protein